MSGWLNWLWSSGSASPLKGKLDSIEVRDAVIGKEIARGAFGKIFEITCGKEKYAGQELSDMVLDGTKNKVLQYFPAECTRIGCLDHANVVKMRGVSFQNSSLIPLVVLESYGCPLSQYLLKNHVEPSQQLGILYDVARGLRYIHGLQTPVLHLCLTPDNIVLDPSTFQAKLFNPGVAKLMQLTPSWCRSKLPGAESFLPLESDTTMPTSSFDIFSFGALMIHVIQPQPEPISPPVFRVDPHDHNRIIMDAFVTVDKVMDHGASVAILCKVLESHPMYSLVQKCLMKSPTARPTATRIVEDLETAKKTAVHKMVDWEADIKRKTEAWLEDCNSLTITVIGRTGTGKSSLMNGLLGKKLAKEGDGLNRETTIVEPFVSTIEGVEVTIWDTPGLQDGVCADEVYLQDMIDKGCIDANLKLYCISMGNTRFDESEIAALGKFTTKVGVKFWDRCMFVLTFANAYAALCRPDIDEAEWLRKRIVQWQERIKSELIKVGVDNDKVEQILIVPTGYHQPLKHALNPWKLPGINNWFFTFWYKCADVMDPAAVPALVKANRHRFQHNITEEDLQTSVDSVPLPFLQSAGEIVGVGTGATVAGLGVGAGIGALVGAVVGIVGGPVGVLGGAVVGAEIGAAAGGVAATAASPALVWGYLRYRRRSSSRKTDKEK